MQYKREENLGAYSFGDMLRTLRKANDLTLKDVATHFGKQHQAIQKWESGLTRPKSKDIPELARLYKVPVQQLIDALEDNTPDELASPNNAQIRVHRIANNLIDLPFVAPSDRGYFTSVDSVDAVLGKIHKMSIIPKTGETYENSILIELHNDSMEPLYPQGTIVAAVWVNPEQWPYMPGGVYAVVYNNYFVVKRITTNDLLQMKRLNLQSDNPQGGSIQVPMEQIHHIFHVKYIVYAPAQ